MVAMILYYKREPGKEETQDGNQDILMQMQSQHGELRLLIRVIIGIQRITLIDIQSGDLRHFGSRETINE